MRKYHKLLCTFLALCMLVSVLSVGAMAAQPSTTAKSTASTTFKTVTPTVMPTTKVILNPYAASDIIPWPVNSKYGYWKIFLSNFSASKTKIIITKDSPTGPQVGKLLVVPAGGKRMAFYCDKKAPLDSGIYYLSLSTDGRYNFKGNLYFKCAETYAALF